jgi:hypothetical protein
MPGMLIQDKLKLNLLRWGPAFIVMIAVFIFSSIPSTKMPSFGLLDFSIKKLGHMLGYALLARAYLHGIGYNKPRATLLAWLLTIIYAITDEFHQYYVPGRSARLLDVGFDSLGSFCGLLPVLLCKKNK